MLDSITSRKNYANDDTEYQNYNSTYQKEKASTDYASALERWKTATNNTGDDAERLFAEQIRNSVNAGNNTFSENGETFNAHNYEKVANAYISKDDRNRKINNTVKKANVSQDAWRALQQIKYNPDFDINTIDENQGTTIKAKHDKLLALFNEDGTLNVTNSGFNDDNIGNEIDKRFKALTDEIRDLKNKKITANIADTEKRNARNSSSGNSSDNSN